MIYELLGTGADNARTGKDLAQLLNCSIRDVTAQIEKERREGQPICAKTGERAGYFLAADEEELHHYCERLRHRAGEMFATRQALLSILKQYSEQRQQEDANAV